MQLWLIEQCLKSFSDEKTDPYAIARIGRQTVFCLRFLITPLGLTADNRATWTKLTSRITGKSEYIPRKLGIDPNQNKQYRPKSTNYNLKGPLE